MPSKRSNDVGHKVGVTAAVDPIEKNDTGTNPRYPTGHGPKLLPHDVLPSLDAEP